MKSTQPLTAGQWVQVQSKEEILATLDEAGRLDGLPFMPEMLDYCGQRFRVFKRAHKTCDPPNGLDCRRMLRAVHLEGVRCDGEAHGGCQARCLIFWKEAWLKTVDGSGTSVAQGSVLNRESSDASEMEGLAKCSLRDVCAATQRPSDQADSEPSYVCQSTELAAATQPLRWWDLRQYIEDYTSRNVRLPQMGASFLFFIYHQAATAGLGLGSFLRWAYDAFQRVRGGTPYPWRIGKLLRGSKTPSVKLDLQPGELVRVKSYEDVLETLDENGLNRGMWFDAEMVPFCGGTYRVLDRVKRIINEKTGKLQEFKNECIMLEGVVCQACYAKHRRFCPRSIYPYWREIWLERVGPSVPGA